MIAEYTEHFRAYTGLQNQDATNKSRAGSQYGDSPTIVSLVSYCFSEAVHNLSLATIDYSG